MKPLKILPHALSVFALAAGMAAMTAPDAGRAQSLEAAPHHGKMHVTKSPTCGCCTAWVALARQEGYEVETTDTASTTAIKADLAVPRVLWSCHTAQIAGYIIEGHVPFEAVDRLLTMRPDIAGIAVPGMPAGSPGMGDDPAARFDVIAFGGTAGAGKVFYQAGL